MQISKKLVVKKEIVITNAVELINSLDITLADNYCKNLNYEKGLNIYKNLIDNIQDNQSRDIIIQEYINHVLIYGQNLFNENKYLESLEQYRSIITYKFCPISVYKYVGLCLRALGNINLAIKFLEKFEEVSPDKEDIYIYLAELTYLELKDYPKAIYYYEKILETQKDNYKVYNMLGHLYSTYYQDKFKEKQIEYLTKAYELAPQERVVVKNLAFVYGKFKEIEKADEFYKQLIHLNPTHSDLHSYGAYLIQNKRFQEGFEYLQHRFLKEDLNNVIIPKLLTQKKKRWNKKIDLSNKHLLVHFEQGFGDSIMFVRFIEQVKTMCKKVSLVVQASLISLFESSNLGIDIYTEDKISEIMFDYYIPMMDLPILCKTTPKTIPASEGYLKVSEQKINEYRMKYINKNDKIKIGIAYEGTIASKKTDRDIPLTYLYPLMRLPDVEVYSFQVDDVSSQMDMIPADINLIRLGNTFQNWEDTACAMNCMDLMVTTDNGVMNLAGALGIKTFALFNKFVEWRWFEITEKDIVWYKSIKPFQCPTSKAWEIPVGEVMKEIDEFRCKKIAKNF